MLNTIKIENFRLFEHLEIKGLKRVNVFAGKNNCGKTALLEALRISAAGEDVTVMRYILQQRGENQNNYRAEYDPFFYRPTILQKTAPKEESFVLSINEFSLERVLQEPTHANYLLGTGKHKGRQNINTFSNNLPHPLFPRDKYIYVPFSASDHFPLSFYWDQVALTPKEDKVIEILKRTILPNLIRLDVQQNERIMVRLDGEDKPIPLKSLGDGAQRMLLIAVALVMAKDNVLLIDEIETGLHYSVLEQVWDIIFRYSEELNVQVFATTHSQDALTSFVYLLEKPENEQNGVFFRLQFNPKSGLVEAIRYEPESLELSLESNLDPR